MKNPARIIFFIFLINLLSFSWLAHSYGSSASTADRDRSEASMICAFQKLTPAQEYAGELLAYLLKVVLGRAGQKENRAQWENRGIDEELDFDHVLHVMTDLDQNQLDLMVLDPNILPLTDVLYHYDERLSIYKGEYGVTGVYPSPEVVAIRLFLLKKIHAGEKMDLDTFMAREKKFLNPDYEAKPEDLAETLLKPHEMKFIREIFFREPGMYRYLTCPFLLKEIVDTGVVPPAGRVKKIIEKAHHSASETGFKKSRGDTQTVNICVLSSMTREFVSGWPHGSLSKYGFRATEFLREIHHKLESQILAATRENIENKFRKSISTEMTDLEWEQFWKAFSIRKIKFFIEDERPFVICPENASRVSREVCPDANFTIILMGKNTYRAIDMDPAKDILYIDIMDIQYDMAKEEIDTIGQFIAGRLIKPLTAAMAELGIKE